MENEAVLQLWPLILVGTALGGLVMLRALALFREHQITPYDAARQAVHIRYEHERAVQRKREAQRQQQQQQQQGDEIVV